MRGTVDCPPLAGRTEWCVNSEQGGEFPQAGFIPAKGNRMMGSPQCLHCGAYGGPAPEAVKVQLESLQKFVEERKG